MATVPDEMDGRRNYLMSRSEFINQDGVLHAQSLPRELVVNALPIAGVQSLDATRDELSSSRATARSGSPVRAIPMEPTWPTMMYRGTLTPEDIKRIVEKNELVEKTKIPNDNEKCMRDAKAGIDWTAESRMRDERAEWNSTIHQLHSSQLVQFDQIISHNVGEVMTLIHNLSSSVEARFAALEIARRQSNEVSNQLQFGLESHRVSLNRALDSHLHWRTQHDEHFGRFVDGTHEELARIRQELEILRGQSDEHAQRQTSNFEGLIDQHKAVKDLSNTRYMDLTSTLEKHCRQQEEEMTKFVRVEDQCCFATKEDFKQLEEFAQQFALPADAHQNMEVGMRLFSAQMNEKLEVIQQSCATLEAFRNLEERLQSFSIQTSQKLENVRELCVPLEAYQSLEERVQLLSLQTDQKLDKLPQTFVPLKAYQCMEKQLESLTSQTHEKLEAVLHACVPLDMHRSLEEHIKASMGDVIEDLDRRLQLAAPLDCHSKLEESMRIVEESLSNLHATQNESHSGSTESLQTLQKWSADQFSQLAKLEMRLDTEAFDWRAKFDELGASLKSEVLTCQDLLAVETAARTRELDQLKMKCIENDTAHAALTISHQELTSSYRELSASCWDKQNKDTEADREAMSLEFKTVEEKHNAEITTLHAILQRLEGSMSGDRLKFEKRCIALDSLLQEQQAVWEPKCQAAEARIDTALFEFRSLSGEVSAGFTNMRQKLESTESALERSFQCNQQHFADETRIMNQLLTNNLKEETRLRVETLQELSSKVENETSAVSKKCDTLKFELSKELKASCSQLERTISEQHTTSATSAERQISNLASLTQVTLDKMWQELDQRTEELRNGFAEERNNQLKMGEEERLAFKKAHEDNMRYLEAERDTRLRQTTEIRADFVRAVTKEREDRIKDVSEFRSEVSRAVREWNSIKSSGGLSASRAGSVSIPTGSENNFSLLFGKTQ